MASILTLKDLLGTILSDVVRAQHESNIRTLRLSERYAADGSMAGMKMPSAMIGNLSLSLNYAIVDGIVSEEEKDVNERGVDKILRYVCNEMGELLIKTMVNGIQHSPVDYRTSYSFVDTLPSNAEFLKHIRRRFYALLSEERESLLDKQGKMNEDVIRRILLPAAVEYLLDHEDIRGLFMQQDASGLKDFIYQDFERVMVKELDDVLRESSIKSFHRIQRYGSLRVEIGDEQLAQLPPESVHTMTITINPATQEIDLKDNK